MDDNKATLIWLGAYLTKLQDELGTEHVWLNPVEFLVWASIMTGLAPTDLAEVTSAYTLKLMLALGSIQASLMEQPCLTGEKHARESQQILDLVPGVSQSCAALALEKLFSAQRWVSERFDSNVS